MVDLQLKPGHCSMRGTCGRKGMFGKELPCPYDGLAQEPENDKTRRLLVEVCGSAYAEGPTCCTAEQIGTLRENFNQVDGIISTCPACRNNFRSFFCSFTCSPNQGSFVNVTSTQETAPGKTAVKSVDFFVGEQHGQGFFDSCKNVQVGATNGYAMDLIGGGAKDYTSFFKYLGDEKPIGSPFQINFPLTAESSFTPYNPRARNCTDNELSSRCACIDCPSVCVALPDVPPPNAEPTCTVGPLSCLSFILIVAYAIAVLGKELRCRRMHLHPEPIHVVLLELLR